jgi:filamentous hemagglutinin family protein
MNKWLIFQFKALVFLSILGVFSNLNVLAQVRPDNTLGAENSIVNTNSSGVNEIKGGASRAGNLFHSFEQFSIPTGGSVFFNNATNIQNIISRVTGGSISNIDGLIKANGSANLFLLNPNGITFGTGASLNIGGSFFATTASGLRFADGSIFGVNPTQSSPLLTISTPIGLQLVSRGNNNNNNNINGNINNSGTLAVNAGKGLSLIGANVTHDGLLLAPGGEITVASFSENNINSTTAGTTIISGNIDASNNVSGQTGGKVQILGDRLGIFPNAKITADGNGGGQIFIGIPLTNQLLTELPKSFITASGIYIDGQAKIKADALTVGNGGEIKVFSTNSTRAYGIFSAKGGVERGNGGLIETSGRNFLDVSGISVDANASNGLSGNWLLDPRNIILVNTATSGGGFNGSNPNIFTPTADNATINIRDIETQLNNGTNVTISTGNTGNQEGNITGSNFGINTTNTIPVTLTLDAANNINLDNFGVNSGPVEAVGDRVNIVLQAGNNINLNQAGITTRGGSFIAAANNSILLDNFGITNSLTGDLSSPINLTAPNIDIRQAGINTSGGSIGIRSNSLTLKNTGINNNNSSFNDAQDININSPNISIMGGGINTNSTNTGKSANININAQSISILPGTGLDANNQPQPQGVGINTNTTGTGNSGNIIINTNSLDINEISGIFTSTNGAGNAGFVKIDADSIKIENFSGIGSNTGNVSTGNAGKVEVKTNNLEINNNSGINTVSRGLGNAGDVSVNVNNNARLNLLSGISSNTFNNGNAGKVSVNINNDFLLTNESGVASIVTERANGNGGNIAVITGNLTATDGSQIFTNTRGGGNAGRVDVKASGDILFSGIGQGFGDPSGAFSEIIGQSNSSSGGINIEGRSLSVKNGAAILATTQEQGNTGNISIKTRDRVLFDGSAMDRNGNLQPSRAATSVRIQATPQENQPDSPNIPISFSLPLPTVRINFSAPQLTGNTGNIEIQTNQLTVSNQGEISTNSNGGNAGNLSLNSPVINLNNQAKITATASPAKGKRGDIDLQVQSLLLLRRNSSISNGENRGEGGNITFGKGFIVAIPSENSDIITNATNSPDGNITITTKGLFGIQFRASQTPESDIVASGRVTLNSLNVDPTKGLVSLPTDILDPSTRVATACSGGSANANQFIVTGRGGLPPNPNDPLSPDVIWEDTRIITTMADKFYSVKVDSESQRQGQKSHNSSVISPISSTPATGWVFNDKGEVILISQNSHPFVVKSTSCLQDDN